MSNTALAAALRLPAPAAKVFTPWPATNALPRVPAQLPTASGAPAIPSVHSVTLAIPSAETPALRSAASAPARSVQRARLVPSATRTMP